MISHIRPLITATFVLCICSVTAAVEPIVSVPNATTAAVAWPQFPDNVQYYIIGGGGERWDPDWGSTSSHGSYTWGSGLQGTGYFQDMQISKVPNGSVYAAARSTGTARTYSIHSYVTYSARDFINPATGALFFNQAGATDSIIFTFNILANTAPVAIKPIFNILRNRAKSAQLFGYDVNGDALVLYEVSTVVPPLSVTPTASADGFISILYSGTEVGQTFFDFRIKDASNEYSLYKRAAINIWDTPEELRTATEAMAREGIGANGIDVDPSILSNPNNGTSEDPVTYGTGDLVMAEDDLDHGAVGWGHRRTYSCRNGAGSGLHGQGWILESRPFLIDLDGDLVVSLAAQNHVVFRQQAGVWKPIRPYPGSLVPMGAGYVFCDAFGNRAVFHGFGATIPAWQQGQMRTFYRPSGERFIATYNVAGQVISIVKQIDATTTDEVLYGYASVASPVVATVQRRVVRPSGTMILRTVEYAYYTGAAGEKGEEDNLKGVKVHDGDIGGPLLREFHYRYYRTSGGTSAMGAIRYAVGPRNCARMRIAGIDPWTTTDTTIAAYADKAIQYTNSRVTRQDLRTPDIDGTGTFLYSYLDSGLIPGPNVWNRRCTETYPDNSVLLVYTNQAGDPLLKVWKSTAASTIPIRLEGWLYDSAGRETWHIQPNAFVASAGVWYNEAKPDLLDIASGDSPYLNNTNGRIDVRTYYGASPVPAATPTVPGGVEGYLQYLQIKQGELGTATNTALREYLSHTN
jgi:hypothetical protein